ncbi:hypothetical protein [Flavobacterium sp. PL02]|uniref:hypothetical protein n=1 Tax=Flavobacterium sp. PL02 TaxID=3088354 RepID=UPI002B230911|nr:hypothetical protein [Flavobacterium sp. PL02]MEA9412663.1 hypothetical protein [Flavobacterium sp. PL02]
MADNIKANIVDPKLIWEKLINKLSQKFSISYTGNNPYHLTINNKETFVFLRNLTRAYTNHSPDVCRIQLHKNNHFEEIKESKLPFMAIGYYNAQNTIATWLSESIKPRLNGKGNVSLYCRFSEMISSDKREIWNCSLRNGSIVQITNFEDFDLFLHDIVKDLTTEVVKDYDELEKELYKKLEGVIEDYSELMSIQISINFYEEHKLDYNLTSIRNLIKKFKYHYYNKNIEN